MPTYFSRIRQNIAILPEVTDKVESLRHSQSTFEERRLLDAINLNRLIFIQWKKNSNGAPLPPRRGCNLPALLLVSKPSTIAIWPLPISRDVSKKRTLPKKATNVTALADYSQKESRRWLGTPKSVRTHNWSNTWGESYGSNHLYPPSCERSNCEVKRHQT